MPRVEHHDDNETPSRQGLRWASVSALLAVAPMLLEHQLHAQQVCVTEQVAIPDGQRSVAIPLRVAARGSARQARVHVRVSVTIAHPWVGDLQVLVRHPSGVEVVVVDRPGFPSLSNFPGPWGCGGDGITATFDDAAAADAETICEITGTAIAGEFRPFEALTAFDGLPPDGEWIILVSDLALVDAGTVESVCLELASADVVTCPADLDGNGAVDGADLAVLLGKWGASCENCPADLNQDGTIGGADLAIVLGAWGACGG